MSGHPDEPLPEEPLPEELLSEPLDELPDELEDPDEDPDDEPEELDEPDDEPDDDPEDDPLLDGPDDPDDPDELGGVELELSQQPSPSDRTSHLQLSAKCLAKPYVPAGTLSAVQQATPDDAG